MIRHNGFAGRRHDVCLALAKAQRRPGELASDTIGRVVATNSVGGLSRPKLSALSFGLGNTRANGEPLARPILFASKPRPSRRVATAWARQTWGLWPKRLFDLISHICSSTAKQNQQTNQIQPARTRLWHNPQRRPVVCWYRNQRAEPHRFLALSRSSLGSRRETELSRSLRLLHLS